MHFADNDVRLSDDPNLKYRDETDAYTTISTRGHFTPNPKMTSYNPSPRQPYNPPTLSSTEHVRPDDLRADVSKYRPEVYKREKSKILKKIHKVPLGKLLTQM